MEDITVKAPAAIKTIISNDSSQRIQFMDNGAMTIREYNGLDQLETYICVDASTVQKIILNAQII